MSELSWIAAVYGGIVFLISVMISLSALYIMGSLYLWVTISEGVLGAILFLGLSLKLDSVKEEKSAEKEATLAEIAKLKKEIQELREKKPT